MAYPGRPAAPAPGAATPELRIARVRPHGVTEPPQVRQHHQQQHDGTGHSPQHPVLERLGQVVGEVPDRRGDGYEHESRPAYLWWLGHTYTVTTRRVIAQAGLLGRNRRELLHARGYTISERRGPLQRMWGAGTLTLSNGVAQARRMPVPAARIREAAADRR
jgi:hypothetical protein